MRNPHILEISVETLDAAVAAQRGGANRIELCRSLAEDGLTPGEELMRVVREKIALPFFSMVRPRAGDFCYRDAEFAEMKRDIETAKRLGMNGVVLGILKQDRSVDVARTRELVEFARPLPVTFHRAFDVCADLLEGLEGVIRTGAARLLTSGGAATAPQGAEVLARLVAAARDRIILVPGAGITASNASPLARQTGAKEFHAGLSSVVGRDERDWRRFESAVRELVAALANRAE